MGVVDAPHQHGVYLATAVKHGINFFEALVTLAEGRPWMTDAA